MPRGTRGGDTPPAFSLWQIRQWVWGPRDIEGASYTRDLREKKINMSHLYQNILVHMTLSNIKMIISNVPIYSAHVDVLSSYQV